MAAASLAIRLYFLGRLFPTFQIVRHMARAVAPTIPAAAAVLLVRLATGPDRTLARALGELALYFVVTAAFTVLLERDLLREVLGYLRRRQPGSQPRSPVGQSA
jgi:hypothetical protein